MSNVVLLDAAGRRRSPASTPGFHAGRPPRNKGRRYPADPPKIQEIVAVMRAAGDSRHGRRRGEDREALRHLLTSEILVELRSDLDLYGDYEECFVDSVDLLDRYERFFDHSMLMAYQALGVHQEDEDEHEDSRHLLAGVAARPRELVASDEVESDDRSRSGMLADLRREHLAAGQGEQYLTVAQLAARHGVTPQAVYKLIHAGKVEAEERPGGSYRIPPISSDPRPLYSSAERRRGANSVTFSAAARRAMRKSSRLSARADATMLIDERVLFDATVICGAFVRPDGVNYKLLELADDGLVEG